MSPRPLRIMRRIRSAAYRAEPSEARARSVKMIFSGKVSMEAPSSSRPDRSRRPVRSGSDRNQKCLCATSRYTEAKADTPTREATESSTQGASMTVFRPRGGVPVAVLRGSSRHRIPQGLWKFKIAWVWENGGSVRWGGSRYRNGHQATPSGRYPASETLCGFALSGRFGAGQIHLHVFERGLIQLHQLALFGSEAAHGLQRARGPAAHRAERVRFTFQAAVEPDHHQRKGQALGVRLVQLGDLVHQPPPLRAARIAQQRNGPRRKHDLSLHIHGRHPFISRLPARKVFREANPSGPQPSVERESG